MLNTNLPCLHEKLEKQGFYIFGAGNVGTQIANFIKEKYCFHGFIDNAHKKKHTHALSSISNKQAVIIMGCVAYEYEVAKQCLAQNFKNILFFAQTCVLFPKLQNIVTPYFQLQENYQKNKNKFANLSTLFHDKQSKQVLLSLINYRQNLQFDLFSQINSSNKHEQYFEQFLPSNIQTFVDGGGFDGQTTLKFLQNFPQAKRIYYFEPDTQNFQKSQKSLKHKKQVLLYAKGIADCNKTSYFDALNNSSASFCNTGTTQVECIALDDIVTEDQAYIKLDIEGLELDAINGAKRLLSNGSPFAICVYHKPSDLYEIPDAIMKINPKYKLYLRHYTNAIFETVLYGICN